MPAADGTIFFIFLYIVKRALEQMNCSRAFLLFECLFDVQRAALNCMEQMGQLFFSNI
jgi:hypothetical protein